MAYPLPSFHFKVEWGGTQAAFAEATGLNVEAQVIEYRDGLSPEYSTIKMPGLKKYGNITLKRGVFADDNEFYDWYNQIKMNKPERRDITISLLNEELGPVMTWRVVNAWPTKITSPDLKANGNEVALESMELAHEGITIENPS
jgi:phage tail-like protein